MQCTSIRTARIATHSLLGGQHGEESEEGKEGQEEEGEEEEVVSSSDDAIDTPRVESSVAKAGEASIQWRNAPVMATPALVDDGGRRRNQGSSFTTRREDRYASSYRAGDGVLSPSVCDGLEFLADALGRSGDRTFKGARHRAPIFLDFAKPTRVGGSRGEPSAADDQFARVQVCDLQSNPPSAQPWSWSELSPDIVMLPE